jgi:hypothetical protein
LNTIANTMSVWRSMRDTVVISRSPAVNRSRDNRGHRAKRIASARNGKRSTTSRRSTKVGEKPARFAMQTQRSSRRSGWAFREGLGRDCLSGGCCIGFAATCRQRPIGSNTCQLTPTIRVSIATGSDAGLRAQRLTLSRRGLFASGTKGSNPLSSRAESSARRIGAQPVKIVSVFITAGDGEG